MLLHPRHLFTGSYTRRMARIAAIWVWLCLQAPGARAQAPKADSSDKVRINIINTLDGYYFKTDSGEFRKFVGDVILTQGTDTLYCDSVIQNSTTKNLEAYSNVRVVQLGGTEGTCNYLRYTSDKKLAYMQGNVSLTDGKNRLWSEELTYDLGTKTGVYTRTGTLQSDTTTVSSQAGVYNVKTKDARFTGNVLVTDPRYKIKSKDLGYNTETKISTFFDHSVVTSDSGRSILVTSGGTYDSKNVIAHFTGHSSIWNDGEYIEADSMHYNKLSGYGYAIGHVISIDTAQHITLFCGRSDFFKRQRVLWAFIKPVLQLANGKDTFYMRADTFYSAPMVKIKSRYPAFRMPRDSAAEHLLTVGDLAAIRLDSIATAKHRADSIAAVSAAAIAATPHESKTKRNRITSDTAQAAATPPVKDTVVVNGVVITDSAKTTESKTGWKNRKQKKVKDTTATDDAALANTKITEDTIWALPAKKFRLTDFFKDTLVRSLAAKTAKPKAVKSVRISRTDTTDADTSAPVFFTGYHHVLIFSDSMQAKCDSVVYTRSDSIIRMVYAPIAWAHNSQITGDTIMMQLDSNSVKSMYVPVNSFVASQSGPDQAQIWDQVQGISLTAFFKGNAINKMIVRPDAQSIYYSKDDGGAYLGVQEASSDLMRVLFADQKINKIKFEHDVKQTMTPLDQADLPNTKLGRFKWLIDQRPKSKEELFK